MTVGPRSVEGRVRLAGEQPPADSFVVLLEHDVQRDGSFRFMAQKLTASEGSWSVPYLHAGRYRVRVIPISGVAKASEALEFTVGDEDPEPLEVVLTPGAALAVHVVDATGAAIAAARLAAVGGDGRSVLEVNRSGTDSEGRGEVFGLAPGRVRLRVSADGYADAELEIELAAGERHELDVELERP